MVSAIRVHSFVTVSFRYGIYILLKFYWTTSVISVHWTPATFVKNKYTNRTFHIVNGQKRSEINSLWFIIKRCVIFSCVFSMIGHSVWLIYVPFYVSPFHHLIMNYYHFNSLVKREYFNRKYSRKICLSQRAIGLYSNCVKHSLDELVKCEPYSRTKGKLFHEFCEFFTWLSIRSC